MSEEHPVAYEVVGPIAYVSLDRPEYSNSQNSVMTYALDAAFTRAVEDDAVKVIVLRGNGKHFTGGHDIGTPGRDHHVSYDNKAAIWWDHTTREGGDQRFAHHNTPHHHHGGGGSSIGSSHAERSDEVPLSGRARS